MKEKRVSVTRVQPKVLCPHVPVSERVECLQDAVDVVTWGVEHLVDHVDDAVQTLVVGTDDGRVVNQYALKHQC